MVSQSVACLGYGEGQAVQRTPGYGEGQRGQRTWMVNTMPTKPAVSRETPRERGPTSLSCSTVFLKCTRPRARRTSTCPDRIRHAMVRMSQRGSALGAAASSAGAAAGAGTAVAGAPSASGCRGVSLLCSLYCTALLWHVWAHASAGVKVVLAYQRAQMQLIEH